MKTLSIILFASITVVSVNAQTQSMGNSKTNADFSHYKSFTWVSSTDNDKNAVIQDAINNELEGRGFRETPDNGDLIVTYRVLEKKGKIHGYKDDNPIKTVGGKQVRQRSDIATFNIEPGTMMVNLVDTKTSETVWTGFSSGVIHTMPEADPNSTDEMQLREAVHTIFENFKYDISGTSPN